MVKLTFLGTANAFGHNGRLNSCYFIQGSKNILLDAGPSIFSAMKKNHLSIRDIDAILLSHLHPDHYLGVVMLVLENYYVTKRKGIIPIYGPIGTKELITNMCTLMYNNEISEHINELYQFDEFGENEERLIPGGKVKTYPAQHTGNARMQLITIDDKKIGYTGDSAFLEASLNEIVKSDILITETSSSGFKIPDHISLEEILELKVPPGCKVYLSHLGDSVRVNRERVKHPFYLADDNLSINL